jgi:hypothetical protein
LYKHLIVSCNNGRFSIRDYRVGDELWLVQLKDVVTKFVVGEFGGMSRMERMEKSKKK